MQGEEGKALTLREGDVSPGPGATRQTLRTPAQAPQPRLTFLLLFCLFHPPCLALSLPSSFCCLPHLTPVQTAMEVEGAGEAEEQRGRRLSDFYDIHQEIGRCGARRGRGAWEPKGAWF